jgi:hypothetical protein
LRIENGSALNDMRILDIILGIFFCKDTKNIQNTQLRIGCNQRFIAVFAILKKHF